MAVVRVRLRFLGEVQGVGFRQFIRNRSGPLAVGGFVQNLPDGSVLAEWEGQPENIDALERAVREEHPLARVKQVSREDIPPVGSRPPVGVR